MVSFVKRLFRVVSKLKEPHLQLLKRSAQLCRLLPISNHPENILYKTNHLFFHFTKLTTLIHIHQGRTPQAVFLQQAPPRGEQQRFCLILSPPPPRANIEGKIFVGFPQKFFTFRFGYLIYKKFKKRGNCDILFILLYFIILYYIMI